MIRVIELAPRKVPPSLVARLLFGGGLGVFAWLFTAFGMAFVLGFVPNSKPDFTSYDVTAFGEIDSVDKTSKSENDEPVFRVAYTFNDDSGVAHHGESYTTDSVSPHTECNVEYSRENPDASRIQGMRRSPFGVFGLFVLLFPILGLGLAARVFFPGLRAARLLRRGIETTGTIVNIAPTKLTVNDVRIMRATVEYRVGEQTKQTTFDFPEKGAPAIGAITRLVYDPNIETRASTLDDLPGQPRITPDGKLTWSRGSAALVLILPVVAVLEMIALPFLF